MFTACRSHFAASRISAMSTQPEKAAQCKQMFSSWREREQSRDCLKPPGFGTSPSSAPHLRRSTCGCRPHAAPSAWECQGGQGNLGAAKEGVPTPSSSAHQAQGGCTQGNLSPSLHTHRDSSSVSKPQTNLDQSRKGDRHEQTCWKRLEAEFPQPQQPGKLLCLPGLQN